MASKTSTSTTAATPVDVDVLDSFETDLVTVVGIEKGSEHRHILSKVILGGVVAAMIAAVDADLPPLKSDATRSEKSGRADTIKLRVSSFIADKTGRFYSWSNLQAWSKAAAVNALLPESIRVTMTPDPSGDPDKAVLSGVFGVWPLQYLAKIEDEDVRATVAERLAASGDVSEQAVKQAVAEALGETVPTPEPKAAKDMTDALVKGFRKSEAVTVARIQHILRTVSEEDALDLMDAGRILWSRTRADAGETDVDRRKRKRVEVFRSAADILVSQHGDEADDDGAEDGSEPVL